MLRKEQVGMNIADKTVALALGGEATHPSSSGRMRWITLLCFFVVLASEDVLGFRFSVATGLSAKNLFLYFIVAWISVEAFVDREGGGFFRRRHICLPLHFAFVALIILATVSLVFVALLLKYPGWGARSAVISLKTELVDHYLMLFVFLAGVSTVDGATRMLKAIVLISAIVSAICLIDMFKIVDLGIMTPREDGRLQGPLGDANDYGGFMAFLIPMAMALFFVTSGSKKLIWLLAVFLFALVLLYSTSRGGLVGLIGGVILTSMLARRYINWRAAIAATMTFFTIGIVAIAILVPIESDLLYSRFIESTQSTYIHNISSARTEIWADGLAEMAAVPISLFLGFGWDTWMLKNDFASHNEYLQWYFELGLLGLFLFISVLFYIPFKVVSSLRSARDNTRTILIGFLMGYLAITIVIFFLNPFKIWLYIWAVSGVSLRLASGSLYLDPVLSPGSTLSKNF
jgi:O-antigen ligase